MRKVGWFDIYVEDMERARAFYETVLDTTLSPMSDPNDPTAQMCAFGDDFTSHGAGGALVKLEYTRPGLGGSMVYFTCDDCAVEEARVEAAGGSVVQTKRAIGDHGFVSIVNDTEDYALPIQLLLLITVLTLLPAILITVTSFTRIVIVLSFVRRALSTNELPPTQVVIGLSLFLTSFVMAPVAERIHERAWVPYRAGEMGLEQAGQLAWEDLGGFLLANTRTTELDLFADLAAA